MRPVYLECVVYSLGNVACRKSDKGTSISNRRTDRFLRMYRNLRGLRETSSRRFFNKKILSYRLQILSIYRTHSLPYLNGQHVIRFLRHSGRSAKVLHVEVGVRLQFVVCPLGNGASRNFDRVAAFSKRRPHSRPSCVGAPRALRGRRSPWPAVAACPPVGPAEMCVLP